MNIQLPNDQILIENLLLSLHSLLISMLFLIFFNDFSKVRLIHQEIVFLKCYNQEIPFKIQEFNQQKISMKTNVCLVSLLISVLLVNTSSYDIQYQKIAECENNDFYVVEYSENDPDKDPIHKLSVKPLNPTKKLYNVENQLKKQNSGKKQVKCRKWIYSYKVKQTTNLRKQLIQVEKLSEKVSRLLQGNDVNSIPQNKVLNNQIISVQRSSYSRSGTSSSSSQQRQSAKYNTIFMQVNMINNQVLY